MLWKDYILSLNKRTFFSKPCFIFHASHCGSTLLGQMLTQKNDIRVVSEPSAFTTLLNLTIDIKLKKEIFDALVLNFCVNQNNINHTCIKFKSRDFPLLQEFSSITSKIKTIFIYREPSEIIASRLFGNKGTQVKPSDDLWSKYLDNKLQTQEEIECDFINVIFNTFSSNISKNVLNLNYNELIEKLSVILSHLEINTSEIEFSNILNRSKFYSKGLKQKEFTPDSTSKQKLISKDLQKVINQFCEVNYNLLNSQKNTQ
jgi:hypothetical protein